MISDLQPFSDYKPSDVPWLSKVPAHWEVRRLRYTVLGCINGVWGLDANGVDDVHCVRVADFDRSRMRVRRPIPTIRAITASERLRRILAPGDLLLEKSGGGEQQPVGVVVLFDHDVPAVSSNFIARMPVRSGYEPVYISYLHSSLYAMKLNTRSIKQTTGIQNLDSAAYLSEPVPLPPLSEQRAIVRYLDHVDRRIRRYIDAKRKLIDLLEEEKQAIINQAVTRGIDPNVRLKPSGVEWLVDVPEHWEVMPVKRAFLSMDYGISESASDSGAIRLLTMGHLKDGQVIVPNDGGVDFVAPHLLLQKGDLLFNRTNSQELVGKVGLFIGHDTPVTFASYLVRMRPHPSHEPEYLNIALNDASFISRARREAIPSLHQSNLNPTRFGRIHTALPSKEEQVAILRTLREETKSLGTAIAAARRQIELLQEYRTRLISDVVTGKLDVCEAAAQLPEEDDEGREPIEEKGPILDNMDEDS